MKKQLKTEFLDKAHKWTVRSLMGITVAGCVVFGFQVYNYVNYVRPARTEVKRKHREEEVALEQQEKEIELLQRQREAESYIVKY